MRSLVALTLLACLVGCAGVKPDALSKTDLREEIVLPEAISVVSYRGINVRWEEGAVPGTYKAEREDPKGVYYFGSGRSIWMTNEAFQKKPRLYVGGIFLPRDTAKGPQFFYIFERNAQTTDNIYTYIQERIASSAANPTVSGDGKSLRANAAGNLIGGLVVDAIIDSAEGAIEMFPPIEDVVVRQKILGALRKIQEAVAVPPATN